jgi:class 3 adenylate cyclase/FixJ family two-component response regulator
MSGELILVVDDGKENRDFIVEYVLEPNGYETLEARDGREGLEMARAHRPALILLDLQMPHMDGLEVIDALDAEQLEIPIILMTFHGSEEIAIEVYRKGVRDYVKKPYTVEEMYDAIDRSLSEVRLRQERDQLTERLIAANAQLNQRVRELNVLYKVGKSVTALLDIDSLMTRVGEAASQLASCEEASVYLLEDDELRCKAICRQADQRTYPMDEIREDELARIAITKKEPVVLGEEELEAMRRNNPSAPTAAMATPLLIAGNPVGALVVKNLSAGARAFTRNDGALLSALSDYAAIAYENASHHEQTTRPDGKNMQPVLRRSVVTDILDQALADHEAVAEGGRRAEISILAAEVQGHQAFSKKAPAGQIVTLLNSYIELAVQSVFENHGTIDRLAGESISAFFNAPTNQPDHERLVVRTALSMQQAAHKLKEQRGGGLDFGIALHYGAAVVGYFGVERSMSYTAIGESISIVERVKSLCQPGQILITEPLARRVEGWLTLQRAGSIDLPGTDQPLDLFEIVQRQT